MKNKKLLLASMSLLAAASLAACSGDTIATTKNGNVTKTELYDAMVASVGEQTLQNLVLTKVLEANVPNKDELKASVDKQVVEQMAQFGGEQGLLSLLQQRGLSSIDDYKQRLYFNELLPALITAKTTVSDEDLQAYYDTTWQPEVEAAHILVADEATATDLIAQLNNGANWDELAANNSLDTSNKDQGGSLGTFGSGSMVPEFETAAYALKTGEISSTPVQTQFGYHIIRMINNPGKGTFEESKEAVKTAYLAAKSNDQEHVQNVLRDVLLAADIKISEEKLKHAFDELLTPPEVEQTSATESSAASQR